MNPAQWKVISIDTSDTICNVGDTVLVDHEREGVITALSADSAAWVRFAEDYEPVYCPISWLRKITNAAPESDDGMLEVTLPDGTKRRTWL